MKIDEIGTRIGNCTYVILDQRKILTESGREIQERFFQWWENYWNDVLSSVGINEGIDPAEFFGQHKVTALLSGNDIVTMHLLSVFDRADFSTHPYFKKFDRTFVDTIKQNHSNRLLTLQYLAFDPKFKKEKPFIYFPMTIGSLSILHQKVEDAKMTVSVARKDLGVSNALMKMGFSSLQEDGVHNNTPVSYQAAYEPMIYPTEAVRDLTLNFWENQISLNDNNTQQEVA